MSEAKYAVGQKLWFVCSWRPTGNCEVIIERVGRKWAYFKRWGHTECRVEHGNNKVDGHGKVYASREAYEAERSLEKAWNEFRSDIGRTYRMPDGVALEDVNRAREALRMVIR